LNHRVDIRGLSNKENKPSHEVALFYQAAYDEEMIELAVRKPDHCPKATETLDEMIQMIEDLIQKGMAYTGKTEFGTDVFFRVEKFKDYGKLSKRKLKDMIAGTRVEPGEAKDHPGDFALWKAAKPQEPSWDSPWGKGRPGWHIECSAMIKSLFGSKLDIHMGGLDLVFPHHENEIAQSESESGEELAPYWIHNGMIEFNAEKMSKSLGNIISTREFLKSYGAETLRVLVHQQHYRSPMDLSQESIIRAEALIDRLYVCKEKAKEHEGASSEGDLPPELAQLTSQVEKAFSDDFNTAKALGFILGAARKCFKEDKPSYWKAWGVALKPLNEVFGLTTKDPEIARKEHQNRKRERMGISDKRALEIEKSLNDREMFRAQKKFEESDRIRAELGRQGIEVMDGPDGATWTVSE